MISSETTEVETVGSKVGSKEGGPALDRSKLPLGASVGDSMKHGKPKGRPAKDPQMGLGRFKPAKRQKL